MPRAGRGREWPDHAGCRPGAGEAPRRGIPDPRHSLQFRRRGGQLLRMGAGPAAIVLGGRGSDAARIRHPRSRLRHHGAAGATPTRFRIGRRRWRSAWRRFVPPRTREACSRDHQASTTSSFSPAISRRPPPLTRPCLRARRPGSTAAMAPTASCSRSTTRRWNWWRRAARAPMRTAFARCWPPRARGCASICFRTSDIAKMHRRLDRLTLKPEADCRGRKPRCDLRRDAVMEAHASGNGGHARRPPVLPRARQGAAAVGANHDRIDHGDGPCRGLDVGPRTGRRALWRAARPRHGARSLASRLGPADVLPLRRPASSRSRTGRARRPDTSQDRLRGLCWRVADIDATHARLVQAGVDVSEVRTGRKPGTRVMTVRSGTLRRADAAGAAVGGGSRARSPCQRGRLSAANGHLIWHCASR